MTCCDRLLESATSESRPFCSWIMISGIPPARVATTGTLHTSASRMLVPRPSVLDVIRNTSSSGRSSGMSVRYPVRNTLFAMPSVFILFSIIVRSLPSPMIMNAMSSRFLSVSTATLRKVL